jgi:hypothetical protein
MQENRCSSRRPHKKCVISAGKSELPARASRLDQFELQVPRSGPRAGEEIASALVNVGLPRIICETRRSGGAFPLESP